MQQQPDQETIKAELRILMEEIQIKKFASATVRPYETYHIINLTELRQINIRTQQHIPKKWASLIQSNPRELVYNNLLANFCWIEHNK